MSPAEVIAYLREHEITLTWNLAVLHARATATAKTVTVKTSCVGADYSSVLVRRHTGTRGVCRRAGLVCGYRGA